MPDRATERETCEAMKRVLLWDLAGTLLVRDRDTLRTGPLPGWREALPRLARDWRLVVATGEEPRSARSLLAEAGLLPWFEEIHGDLLGHGGKPHGDILRALRAEPACSLAIGDRLRGDLPADCDDLVLLLVGARDEAPDAERIAAVVETLAATGPNCAAAFRRLAREGEARIDSIGPIGGGAVTAAWRHPRLPDCELWIFEPDWMDARRPVIVV